MATKIQTLVQTLFTNGSVVITASTISNKMSMLDSLLNKLAKDNISNIEIKHISRNLSIVNQC